MIIRTESRIIVIQLKERYYVIVQDIEMGKWKANSIINGSNFEISKNQDYIVTASGT